MLRRDASQRPTISQVRCHPWARSYTPPRVVRPDVFLISPDPADDLDETALSMMQGFGVSRDAAIKAVMEKQHNCLSTTYYLLLQKLHKQRQRAGQAQGQGQQQGKQTAQQRPSSASRNVRPSSARPVRVGVGAGSSQQRQQQQRQQHQRQRPRSGVPNRRIASY